MVDHVTASAVSGVPPHRIPPKHLEIHVNKTRTRRARLAAVGVAGALSLFAVACNDNADVAETTTTAAPTTEAPPTSAAAQTIVDIAVSNPDFSILVEAVTAAGLVETLQGAGPFTVFAPTNAAFGDLLTLLKLTKEQLLADTETLTKVLTYHVVPGKVLAADVVGLNGKDVATVEGGTVKVTVEGETVKINESTVVQADIEASNGVIHVIDKVLLPAAVQPPKSISQIAIENPDFSILVEAVTAAGLLTAIEAPGPFTVFAPTNAAFEAALAALKLTKEQLFANTELLTAVLTYHVFSGKVLAADVVGLNGQEVTMLNNLKVKVTVEGETVKINDATVTTADLVASNGVIHVIDKVLLPPA